MKTHKAWFIRYQGPESEWVPADVAQGLREAVLLLLDGSFEPEDIAKARAALAAADGEVGDE